MARDPKYDCLFEPIAIGPKVMKNRFYQVPHCIGAGVDEPGTQAAHRAMKAEGGWGAVCTEACSIHPDADSAPTRLASLWDEGDVHNLRHMTDAVHAHGALAGVEMTYSGHGSTNLETRAVPLAVHAWAPVSHKGMQAYSREADADDLAAITRAYVDGAKRARDAGFDIVYVYSSHRNIMIQFLMNKLNHRTDEYGGALENRARLLIDTLGEIKQAVGSDCAVAVRFSVDQLLGPEGLQVHEDGLGTIELAEKAGVVDLWDINITRYTEWIEDAGTSRLYPANHQAPWVRLVKTVAKKPVLGVGRMTSPDDMVEAITSGQLDIIGAARPSIADPFLPKKIEEGRNEDIRECIGCNMCVSRWERGARIVCTQNATTNEEFRRGWHPERFEMTPAPCSVLVVGAGPSGLECARVLGMRGYDVHLREAADAVGGNIRDVMCYPGLAEWGRVVSYRSLQLDKLKNVEVHTGVGEMTADDVLGYGADKVVLATGSRWAEDGMSGANFAAIPGADASAPQVLTPEQVMAGKPVGERVVVLDADGYFTGIGMAEMMADAGKQVSVITHYDVVGPMHEYTAELSVLRRMMNSKGITALAGRWVERLEVKNQVRVVHYDLYRGGYERSPGPTTGEAPFEESEASESLDVDSVILVTARKPNRALWDALEARRDEWVGEGIAGIYQAGDCYAPRMIAEAVFDGHRIAREFESENPQAPLPVKRERILWAGER